MKDYIKVFNIIRRLVQLITLLGKDTRTKHNHIVLKTYIFNPFTIGVHIISPTFFVKKYYDLKRHCSAQNKHLKSNISQNIKYICIIISVCFRSKWVMIT